MKENKHSSRGVLGSLSAAVGRLRRNPVILVGALLVTLLSELITLLGFIDPIVANLSSVFWIVVCPFLIAGLLGMILEARTGRSRLATLLSSGNSHYLSMLGATLLFMVIMFGVIFFSFVLTFILVLGAAVGTAGDLLEGGISLLLVALALLIILPYVLVYLFFQFYDVGIVAGGESATSSISHSFGLVRQNFFGVVGYTIVFFLIQTIGYGPGYAVLFLGGTEITDTGRWVIVSEPLLAVGSLLTLILGTLAMALAFTYHVTFYESLRSEPDDREFTNGDSVAV